MYKSNKTKSSPYSIRLDDDITKELKQFPTNDIRNLFFAWLDSMREGTIDIYSVLYQWELDKIKFEIESRKSEIEELELMLNDKMSSFKYYQESTLGEVKALDNLWETLKKRHFTDGKIYDVEDIQVLIDFCFIPDERCVAYCLNRMAKYEDEYYLEFPKSKRDKGNPYKWLKNRLEHMQTDEYKRIQDFETAYSLRGDGTSDDLA